MRWRLVACLALFAALLPTFVWAETPALRGDARAVAAAERMLERLGGREVWANARSIFSEIEGWRATPVTEPVVIREWWDLTEARKRSEHAGRSEFLLGGLSTAGNWTSHDGVVTRDDPEMVRKRLEHYPYLTWPSLHALAIADQRFILEWVEPNRILLRSPDGRERSWWETDQTGAPTRWGTLSADGVRAEYVWGPVRAFGVINYPMWGGKTDGSFRYNFTSIEISAQPLTGSVAPPEQRRAR